MLGGMIVQYRFTGNIWSNEVKRELQNVPAIEPTIINRYYYNGEHLENCALTYKKPIYPCTDQNGRIYLDNY